MTEIVKLGDVCEVLDSLRVPIRKRDRQQGQTPYYGATGVLDQVEGYIFDEPLVLVGEDGAKWGSGEITAFPVTGKSWVNNHAHVLRPNRDRLLDSWLVYILVGLDLTPYVTGMTVPKLNQASLRRVAIPLPPLKEQKRIVERLDALGSEVEALKQNRQRKREEIEVTRAAVLRDLLSQGGDTDMAKLGDVCHAYQPETLGRKHLRDGPYPVFGANGPIGYHDAFNHEEPQLILGCRGSCGVVLVTPAKSWINGNAMVLQPDEGKLSRAFLRYVLDGGVDMNSVISGTAQPQITRKSLNPLEIPLPPVEEQKRIVGLLGQVTADLDLALAAVDREIEEADALNQSYLSEQLAVA